MSEEIGPYQVIRGGGLYDLVDMRVVTNKPEFLVSGGLDFSQARAIADRLNAEFRADKLTPRYDVVAEPTRGEYLARFVIRDTRPLWREAGDKDRTTAVARELTESDARRIVDLLNATERNQGRAA